MLLQDRDKRLARFVMGLWALVGISCLSLLAYFTGHIARNRHFSLTVMPTTHLPETRAGIQRRKAALDFCASFRRELQQNLH